MSQMVETVIQKLTNFIRQQAKRIVAIAIVAGLFWLSRLPGLSATERQELASRFSFTRSPLPELAEPLPQQFVRSVRPSLEDVAVYYSDIGAALALNDLDGDGLSNDVCYVDPRVDKAIVAPVPGTPARYEPFALEASAVPYDSGAMAPTGCLPSDLNEDGQMDILVHYWGRSPIAFLRIQDATDRPQAIDSSQYIAREIVSGPPQNWNTCAATIADLDGDGHNDLIFGQFYRDRDRIFTDSDTTLVSSEEAKFRAKGGGLNRIFLWAGAAAGADPSVRFQEAEGVLDEAIARGWTLAVGTADLDSDLRPEIYFANDFGGDRAQEFSADYLLHNLSKPGELNFAVLKGRKTLNTSKSLVLGEDVFPGMGVDFGDINSDGLPDIYVSNVGQKELTMSHFMFVSTGELDRMKDGIAPYVNRSESMGLSQSGWAWEAKLADFDNDGTLEALQATGWIKGEVDRLADFQERSMANDRMIHSPGKERFLLGWDMDGQQHNPFFVRADNGRYYDLAAELGMDDPQVSRGIATADVDGDGDLDFAVANQWEESYFYHNDNPTHGAFLGLHLELPIHAEVSGVRVKSGHPGAEIPCRSAIGATAKVHLPDGRQLVAQVDGGNGHTGARSPELHFGLGQLKPETSLPVDLHWRDTRGQVHRQTVQLSPGWHTVLLGTDTIES